MAVTSSTIPGARPRRWPQWLLVLGVAWGQITLILGTLSEPTPENLTLLFSIELAGLYTLLLGLTRRFWLPWLSGRPVLWAAVLGSLNAALIEVEFWAFERFFGASGVAASPNLLVDLVLTMPWYIGMVILFVRGQRRSRFGGVTVLFLAGLYEVAADGVIGGQIIPALLGEPVDLIQAWGFLVLVAFWQFVLVYSSMLLPSAWVIMTSPQPERAAPGGGGRGSRLRDALLPLLWALPFTLYVIGVLVMTWILGGLIR